MKKLLPIVGTLLLAITLTGCLQAESEEALSSQQAVISTKPPKPEPMVDIYIPISEQFKESKHSQSLKKLLEYQAKGNTVEKECLSCHSYDYLIAPANAKPSVSQVKYGVTCRACHNFDESGNFVLVSKDMVSKCGECHTNKAIKLGKLAGSPQTNMFEGVGAIDVKGKPDPRYVQGINCTDCHMPNNSHTFKSLTLTNAAKQNLRSSCILCHAKDNLVKFSKLTDDTQARVEKQLKDYTKRLAALKSKKELYLYKRAYTNLTFVDNDGSKGMHNIKYTPLILAQINKDLTELERE